MPKKDEKQPLRIKSLAELKRVIQPGTEIKALSHSNYPDIVGLVRVVTEVQTNAFYSKIKDQPSHRLSACNYGKGFRSILKRQDVICLTAQPSRCLTLGKTMAACCMRWRSTAPKAA